MDKYRTIMTDNFKSTTKNLIPYYIGMYACEKPAILDIGVGSGYLSVLLKRTLGECFIDGIDCELATEYNEYDRLAECAFESFIPDRQYDVIILSSIIHEIISANRRLNLHNILMRLRGWLHPNGIVIIRDGMELNCDDANQVETYELKTAEALQFFVRFMSEFKLFNLRPNLELECDIQINPAINRYAVKTNRWVMREFLCTATWGKESWNREIAQKFCAYSREDYEYVCKTLGYNMLVNLTTSEQYNEYFDKLVYFPNEQDLIGVYVLEYGGK